jgi:putative membrane protein
MLIELVLALILGIIAGTFTGLSPGIHINLISSILLAYFVTSNTSPIYYSTFIVSMSITHTFIDFIPSIFLGAPDEDTFLSVLPGHKLFLSGLGLQAAYLTLYGSLCGIIITLLISPLFIITLPIIYNIISSIIPFILILISIFICLRDKNILIAIMIFLLSGFLGLITFNLPIDQPLTPLLTGLFGLSSLITSIKSKTKIVKQNISLLPSMTKKEWKNSILAALTISPIGSFLPGIGSGHAATIGSEVFKQTDKSFLFLNGAMNTIIMGLSFLTLYSIDKSRSGSAAIIKLILKEINLSNLVLIIMTILISGIVAFFIGLFLSKKIAVNIEKISYSKLNISVILILIILNVIVTNWIGLIVLATSTALGIFAISSDSKRINLMGCLIIPSIIYYLVN